MTLSQKKKEAAEAQVVIDCPICAERYTTDHYVLKSDQKAELVNFEYDPEAKAFTDRLYVCEPPCDSYGVCSECIDNANFGAGYNFGRRFNNHELTALRKVVSMADAILLKNSIYYGDLKEYEEAKQALSSEGAE